MKWIKCSDRMPDLNIPVLTYTPIAYNSKKTSVMILKEDYGYISWNKSFMSSVTHWMPLPNPPSEDDDIIQKMLDEDWKKIVASCWMPTPTNEEKDPYCNFCASPDDGKKCCRSFICDNPIKE